MIQIIQPKYLGCNRPILHQDVVSWECFLARSENIFCMYLQNKKGINKNLDYPTLLQVYVIISNLEQRSVNKVTLHNK